jgi:arginase family enzyme
VLTKSIRILNFDDSITKQKNLLSQYENQVLDLKDLGMQARCWVNSNIRSVIQKRIQNSPKNSITFLGSGDFHHVTELLLAQFDEPLSVITFDFHPDWDTLPPRFGCGSWVNEVLKRKNIAKFILLGVSSADISSFNIQSGNLSSLKDDRVEIYPYSHHPSLIFLKKIPENVSVKTGKRLFFNRIYWDELKNKNLEDFFQNLLKRMPTRKVYVSIDKDCLSNDYALTNWEEGKFSLEEILRLLKLIKQNLDIAGLDITGDYSPIAVKGIFKKITSHLDHPKDIKANTLPESFITALNEETNLKILKLLNS